MDAIDIKQFAHDLRKAREEVTLRDLTDNQWERVCNRIVNALHMQMAIDDWDGFLLDCKPESPSI